MYEKVIRALYFFSVVAILSLVAAVLISEHEGMNLEHLYKGGSQ